jgi:transcriptional regulator with XRE-family HTH domain
MAKDVDHPLRIARVRAGLGMEKLAKLAGVNWSTVNAIEDGRTNHPTPAVLDALESTLQMPSGSLAQQIGAWRALRQTRMPDLSPVAKATLELPPEQIPARFTSFRAWRGNIAGSPTAFAIMLGVNLGVVSSYERGVRVRGMADVLQGAILNRLRVSPAYLTELVRLPAVDDPSDEED